MAELTDVMVDVAPGIVVWRAQGKWYWHAPQGVTKEHVLKELRFQLNRLSLKRDLIDEALVSLEKGT